LTINKTELISVIIPLYNREELILETLNSIKNQAYRPVEVLIIDDHSTDNSKEACSNYAEKNKEDSLNFIIETNSRKGAPAARNTGFKLSKGSYIQFLDSDDLLLPKKLHLDVQFLSANPSCDLIYSKCQFFDQNGKYDSFWGRELTHNSADYFEFSWQTMCALYKREAIDKVGLWNEELVINQDWEYSIRFLLTNCEVKFIPEVRSLIREHSSDSIGKDLSLKKTRGKILATNSIYDRIEEKGLMDSYLKAKFQKRYIFCLLHLNSKADYSQSKSVLNLRKNIIPWYYQILLRIKSKVPAKFVLGLYALIKR